MKVGDRVHFKIDVEGRGEIVEIDRNGTYTIAITRPGSRNAEPTHPAERYSYEHDCLVVYAEEYEIF